MHKNGVAHTRDAALVTMPLPGARLGCSLSCRMARSGTRLIDLTLG